MTTRQLIRTLSVLVAWLPASLPAWADGVVGIVNDGGGEMTFSVAEDICTLTARPSAGYYISAEWIEVVKTIAGDDAQAPRRTPAISEPINLTAVSPSADPTGVTTYTFEMPAAPYDVVVTAHFQAVKGSALLYVGGTRVTADNRLDILGDGGSVQYDGRGMLVLNGAVVEGQGILSLLDQLTIYLKGENRISVDDGIAVDGRGGRLLLTTEGNTPGKLTLATSDRQAAVVSGFSAVSYEQNLTLLRGSADGQEAEIGTPVVPFVDTSGETQTVVLDGGDSDHYDNVIIDNVLYTLDKDNDDDVDRQEHCVVLASTMVDEQVTDILATYQPGTADFAQHFAGLTFMVPAGYGRIRIKARTGEEGVLHVKVGKAEAYVITGAEDFQEFEFPYVCTEATYVYVYSSSPLRSAEATPGHRAGKKTTVTVGVGSIGVDADSTQSSNGNDGDAGGDEERMMTDADIHFDLGMGTVTVDNPEITSLPDDAFSGYSFLKFIDLRGTGITGLEVSREDGPFRGISKNTFIYVPAGNSTGESNVVIGNVCEDVVLDGYMQAADGESFGLSGSFMAQQVTYDRMFMDDETALVYLPFGISAEAARELGKFYAFDGLQQGNVETVQVEDDLVAHTPYIFKPAANGVILENMGVLMQMPDGASPIGRRSGGMPAGRRRADDTSTASLRGSYDFIYFVDFADDPVYRMATDEQTGQVSFRRLQDGEYIAPFEGYLVAPGEMADELSIDGGGTTGVSGATRLLDKGQKIKDDVVYNLNGQRIRRGYKGLVVTGGCKVVMKWE